ncbi:MAG: ACP phosphodiesterase [Cyclobacteriaceae bacterium]
MNFLAHLFLSGDNEKIQVGNFIGDFVKGNKFEKYHHDIQLGIRLHREIDSFTDSHPVVMQSKMRLRAKFRHYSPVIVDVFYDHFLAKNWSNFDSSDLKNFTLNFYEMISGYSSIIPDAVNNMLVFMKDKNWLYNYQSLEGIDRALTGMSRRTKFDSNMEVAIESLKENYNEFEDEFRLFFPELQHHTQSFLK